MSKKINISVRDIDLGIYRKASFYKKKNGIKWQAVFESLLKYYIETEQAKCKK